MKIVKQVDLWSSMLLSWPVEEDPNRKFMDHVRYWRDVIDIVVVRLDLSARLADFYLTEQTPTEQNLSDFRDGFHRTWVNHKGGKSGDTEKRVPRGDGS